MASANMGATVRYLILSLAPSAMGPGNVDAVMDGDLDGFIFAYLKAASRGELQDT